MERAFPSNAGSSMNRKRVGGSRADQAGSSGGAGAPHPNGGEVRRMPLNQNPGKMPRSQRTGRVTHTDLNVGQGSNSGLGKMPREVRTARQTQPVRR